MENERFTTPSEFYRWKRPENFSDSKVQANAIMPKEQLAYELSMISVNQKHDLFENMCRVLAEKLISPNLVPQVGPTGGGDGKTDSETYPVSNFIFDRWYVSGNKWNKDENWAFAISAKEAWKPKVKSDVKKIVETERGYTRIFFFSSRKISSKQKKDTEDELKALYGLDITILDAEWIIEKVYTNKLLNDVINTLNLSASYLEEKIVGPNDAERTSELEIVEDRINSYNRSLEVDYQLVEDCLESAILARELELPKAEVFGKFERAQRFAEKLNDIQLIIRVLYQKSWTLINYYDEYKAFYESFLEFKSLVLDNATLKSIELYFTLFSIINTISGIDEVNDIISIDSEFEKNDLKAFLVSCKDNKIKRTSALLASFYLSFIDIFNLISSEKPVNNALEGLIELFEESKHHIEIAFEPLRDTVKIFGQALPDSEQYDKLLDVVAEIESERVSELSSGRLYLERGITKLENNLSRASLIYFGKAARKLAKEESKTDFFYCLIFLSNAYRELGLYWASYNALVTGVSIYSRIYFDSGYLDIKFLKSIDEVLKNELIIGRIPVILCWYELHRVLKHQLNNQINYNNEEEITQEHLVDACLAIRLLNEDVNSFDTFSYLPDILNQQGLWMSADAVLYLLGHVDKIELDLKTKELINNDFDKYYNKLANQPFADQILYKTDLLDSQKNSIESNVLGVRITVLTSSKKELLIIGELLLAYVESYLATAFDQAFPTVEDVLIEIKYSVSGEEFELSFENNSKCSLVINNTLEISVVIISKIIDSLIPQLISRCFLLKDIDLFFKENYINNEIQERLSIIIEHRSFLTNTLSLEPKYFLSDWKKEDMRNYPVNRSSSPISIEKQEDRSKETRLERDNITHDKIRSETIINTRLWDVAKWRAVGFLLMEEIPFGIFLAFENEEAGRNIFKKWIESYGDVDADEVISITIIRGINKNNPYWYKVLVSKNLDSKLMENGNLVSMASRFHRMDATSSENLDNLIRGYNHFDKYYLIPAGIDERMRLKPFTDLKILKQQLKIIDAWEIGVNDMESIVITPDDDPIVPKEIENPPVEELLREKRKNYN